jgi:hypothetical protein
MVRCPYCKERIRKGAVRCKHCYSSISGTDNNFSAGNEDGVRYLQNGFGKISAECNSIEERINERTGLIFTKHQYSSDRLIDAMEKIESYVEKMQSDLEGWESSGKLAQQTKQLFNRKAGEVYQRLESLHVLIEQRVPTWWETVCTTFKRILAKLLPFLSFKLIAGKKPPQKLAA